MLTESQCIEVAEKVWGWQNYDNENFYSPTGKPVWYPDKSRIERMVNSWTGFGRTVEAMEKRNWSLGMGHDGIYFYTYNPTYNFTTHLDPTGKSKIECVHLAALEAGKEEGDV